MLFRSVITITTMEAHRVTWWALPMLMFSLVAVTQSCKPVKPEKYNPMCTKNPSIPKVCPLTLTRRCPNLLLSDFHTSQSSADSHNQANYGFINRNSTIGLHDQSSVIFFFGECNDLGDNFCCKWTLLSFR